MTNRTTVRTFTSNTVAGGQTWIRGNSPEERSATAARVEANLREVTPGSVVHRRYGDRALGRARADAVIAQRAFTNTSAPTTSPRPTQNPRRNTNPNRRPSNAR